MIAINSVAVLGAGHDGRADRAALRQRRHSGAAARPDRRPGAAGAREGAQAEARSAVHARRLQARHHRRLRHATSIASPRPTGSWRRWSSGSTSSSSCSPASTRSAGPGRSSARTPPAFRSRRWPRGGPMISARHWLGTHFFNPPRYLRLLEIIPTAETDPAVVAAIVAVRRSRARQGRGRCQGHAELHRQSHRACTAWRARSRCWPAASTRSKRSTPSPAPRSAVRAARRSGPWISPASTCSRT